MRIFNILGMITFSLLCPCAWAATYPINSGPISNERAAKIIADLAQFVKPGEFVSMDSAGNMCGMIVGPSLGQIQAATVSRMNLMLTSPLGDEFYFQVLEESVKPASADTDGQIHLVVIQGQEGLRVAYDILISGKNGLPSSISTQTGSPLADESGVYFGEGNPPCSGLVQRD